MRYFLCILIYFPLFAISQRQNNLSRSEIGIIGGGMYYIGDLNQMTHFKYAKPSAGIFYRFNIHSRLAWRNFVVFGEVGASDNLSDKKKYGDVYKNRNLSFTSSIFEIGSGLEFNYFPFQIGHSKYRGTGYLFAEIAYFHMNPKTNLNGQSIELRTIGTEGQNTPLNSKGYYSANQIAIPIGIGFKYPFSNSFCIGFEYGIRKIFTDYLDDVGVDKYPDATTLASYSGPMAAALSNRTLDASPYGPRGNSHTKDWYFQFGITLSMKLGNPDECFKH